MCLQNKVAVPGADIGTPSETAAMGDGLGLFNLQMDAPWADKGINTTEVKELLAARSGGSRRLIGRRLMDDGSSSGGEAAEISDDDLDIDVDPKTGSRYSLEGTMFYGIGGLVAVAVLHAAFIEVLLYATGLGRDEVPPTVAFPGWEVATFQGEWNGLSTSVVMSCGLHAMNLKADGDVTYLVLSNAVLLCVQTPWMVWGFWWLHTNLYGENPSITFEASPLARVFASRPTFHLSQLIADWRDAVDTGERLDVVWRAVKWPFEWLLWLALLPFNLEFQGEFAEVDDPGVPMFLEKYSR